MHLLPPLPPLPPPSPPSLSKSVAVALRDKRSDSTDDDLPIGNTELLMELNESFNYFSSSSGVENESGGGGDGADDLERLKADLDTVQRRSACLSGGGPSIHPSMCVCAFSSLSLSLSLCVCVCV